jgi:hypothetical protein
LQISILGLKVQLFPLCEDRRYRWWAGSGRWRWRWSADGNTGSASTAAFRSYRCMGVIIIFGTVGSVIIIIIIEFIFVIFGVVMVIFVAIVIIVIRFWEIAVSCICLLAEDLHQVTCRQRTFGGCAGARCKVIIHEYVGIEWTNATLDPGFLDGFQ